MSPWCHIVVLLVYNVFLLDAFIIILFILLCFHILKIKSTVWELLSIEEMLCSIERVFPIDKLLYNQRSNFV